MAAAFKPLSRRAKLASIRHERLWVQWRAEKLRRKRGPWTRRDDRELDQLYAMAAQLDCEYARLTDSEC